MFTFTQVRSYFTHYCVESHDVRRQKAFVFELMLDQYLWALASSSPLSAQSRDVWSHDLAPRASGRLHSHAIIMHFDLETSSSTSLGSNLDASNPLLSISFLISPTKAPNTDNILTHMITLCYKRRQSVDSSECYLHKKEVCVISMCLCSHAR